MDKISRFVQRVKRQNCALEAVRSVAYHFESATNQLRKASELPFLSILCISSWDIMPICGAWPLFFARKHLTYFI